ncbi:TPA: hypothetical protein CPT87_02900 [Candidatus Gastranaerophilales bacterium HUM_5]|jgi:hypothetical protein|nr:MAG TPA: hypothetical protein CPT99_00095 [Candidatus Gastranaerophilales bacterium HUM_4]DAA92190.1 MAG TPA: hypothetical protein CPT87_02900 [Candidatus Gastranaerophilales bacterium HUM_5]DAB13901.1 MAG TPA: hypothetical protein CPT97_09065 [Candidatus Gastranaerophilales bacterium HUM_17]DAB17813.1 MAG TPA: hypothetical protein CPT98_05240 [Candidatus Gastranaerophilales bacterium HUM_19]DAZ25006.1 MAG TPA: hypothetical protein [Caudoviricetes sp.]
MAFTIDKDGNITLIQGDSGELVINGLPTDKNYSVYFAIQDENRNPIGSEIELDTNNSSSVIFTITGSLTNLLTVKKDDETATYYYGIKLCNKDDFMEDTLLIGNTQIGSLNTITVYPKKVEGI